MPNHAQLTHVISKDFAVFVKHRGGRRHLAVMGDLKNAIPCINHELAHPHWHRTWMGYIAPIAFHMISTGLSAFVALRLGRTLMDVELIGIWFTLFIHNADRGYIMYRINKAINDAVAPCIIELD